MDVVLKISQRRRQKKELSSQGTFILFMLMKKKWQ